MRLPFKHLHIPMLQIQFLWFFPVLSILAVGVSRVSSHLGQNDLYRTSTITEIWLYALGLRFLVRFESPWFMYPPYLNCITSTFGSVFTLAGLSGLVFPDNVPVLSSESNSSYDGALSASRLFSVNGENSSIWSSVTGTLKLEVRPGSTLLKDVLYRSWLVLFQWLPRLACFRFSCVVLYPLCCGQNEIIFPLNFIFFPSFLLSSISFQATNPLAATGSVPTIEAVFPGVVIPKTELQLPVTSLPISFASNGSHINYQYVLSTAFYFPFIRISWITYSYMRYFKFTLQNNLYTSRQNLCESTWYYPIIQLMTPISACAYALLHTACAHKRKIDIRSYPHRCEEVFAAR